ncbi:MAG: DUF2325 domain-containing protein [Bacillota bacterium]
MATGSEEDFWTRLGDVQVRLLLGSLPRGTLVGLARDLGVPVKGWRLETAPARLLARQLATAWARQADLRPVLLGAILDRVGELGRMMEGLPVAAIRGSLPNWTERWGAAAVAMCLDLDGRVTVQRMAAPVWARALAEERGEEAAPAPPAGPAEGGAGREAERLRRRQQRLLHERDQTIARLEKEVAALEQRLAQREQERARLADVTRRLEKEKGELSSRLQEATGDLERVRQELDRLRQELREPLALQGRVAELAEALAQAESQAQGHQASCAQLGARVQDLESRVAFLTRELEARDVQIDQLKARLAQRGAAAARAASLDTGRGAVPEGARVAVPDAARVLERLVADLERIVRSVPGAPPVAGRVEFRQGWEFSSGDVRMCVSDGVARGLRLLEGDEVAVTVAGGGARVQLAGRVPRRALLGYLRLGEQPVVRTPEGDEWVLVPGEVEATGAADGDPVTVEVPDGARPGQGRARVLQVHQVENPFPVARLPLRRVRAGRRKAAAVGEMGRGQADSQELCPGGWLKDWCVLVVGGDGQEQWYRQAVEKRGGVFEWHSGFEALRPLPGKVRTADLVVLMTGRMSHKAFDLVREAGARFTKKLVYCNELGAGALVRALAGALGHVEMVGQAGHAGQAGQPGQAGQAGAAGQETGSPAANQ